ncbi:MAG: glycosyltransferase [Selenomonas sp.]|nr:glycosyltransferase [Selenomonas sp.]
MHNDTASQVMVLMSTYNGERFLWQQLESIYKQSRSVDRMVIADDGSTDGTVSLIRKFIAAHGLDSRWQLKLNEENLGWKRSFFRLLCAAEGDIVLFCDQDDVWLPQRVERTLKTLAEYPQALCLACRWQPIDAKGHVLDIGKHRETHLISKPGSYFDIHTGEAQSGCLLACKRELLDLIRDSAMGVESASVVPPYDMFLSRYAYFLGGYYAIDEIWHLHRFHKGNATADIESSGGSRGQGRAEERRTFCVEAVKVLSCLSAVLQHRGSDQQSLRNALMWNEKRLEFMRTGSIATWVTVLRLCNGKQKAMVQVLGDLCYRLGIQREAGRLLQCFLSK